MAYVNGSVFKLYYDASGVGGSTWTLLGDVEVVEETAERASGKVKNRASAYEKSLPGQTNLAGSFRMTYNKGSAAITAIQTAFEGGTVIGLAIADGPIATSGTLTWLIDAVILSMPRTQDLDDPSTVSVGYDVHANGTTEPDLVATS